MRAFSKNSFKDLFYKKNCPLSEEDKTFERLTEEINKSFKEWEINTCMRKIQFLAQCYHESAFFSTTLEFASGEYYNPPNPQKATNKKLIQRLYNMDIQKKVMVQDIKGEELFNKHGETLKYPIIRV